MRLLMTVMFPLRVLKLSFLIYVLTNDVHSYQSCPEEISLTGIQVTWPHSPEASCVESDPICFYNDTKITRNCTEGRWIPSQENLLPCFKTIKYFNTLSCPNGLNKISDSIDKYCYQINDPSEWDYPCLENGGATVITDFDFNEMNALLLSLNSSNHKYFWLPAKRQKIFAPIVWYIPGPNWGQVVTSKAYLSIKSSTLKNCLLLDVEKQTLSTETCSEKHPSLCFYINDYNYPAKCPDGYYAFRHIIDEGSCYGIVKSDTNISLQEFLNVTCRKPMGNNDNTHLRRFLFSKIAESINLSGDEWCWFASGPAAEDPETTALRKINKSSNTEGSQSTHLGNVINSAGILGWIESSRTLSCMACEADIIFSETELMFEYNPKDEKIYLTVYFPSGLWKYDTKDRGVQCFSDAKGFFKVIDVYEPNMISFDSVEMQDKYENMNVEKNTYAINLVTERSARYWCEGHTKNFSLISTEKIIVNPRGSDVHVFSLVLDMFININAIDNTINELMENVSHIFECEKVLLMDILDYNLDMMKVLLHIHARVNNTHKEESLNLLHTFNNLKERADLLFPEYNYIYVNMSSSVYCLPTTSEDAVLLEWEMTPIGYIVASKQFCLQYNGLPVNRCCQGSYLYGSTWGAVEGRCDKNYQPSHATTLLFNFVQGNLGSEFASQFLTIAMEFVLNDTNVIIPADIYYLSLSLQHILNIADENETNIETGDIYNIAWIMDRIMDIDKHSLWLAQSLNSTNVILDSITNILMMNMNQRSRLDIDGLNNKKTYQLAIQARFVVQISYPNYCNISGIAIINPSNSENFLDMIVQPLFTNTTLSEVMSINNLEVATWLPISTLKRLENDRNITECDNKTENMHIIINVYYDNTVFQELTTNKKTVNSRIIEISIPGYTTSTEFVVPLVFQNVNDSRISNACGYWDLHSEVGKIPGIWSTRGCVLIATVLKKSICECYHLTHFGQLINVQGVVSTYENDDSHSKALNIITVVGSSLSLLGIIGIWITAIVFDMWRKKTGTKVLLQLSFAISLPLILIIFFNLDDTLILEIYGEDDISRGMKIICVILGALFHYSVLANFVWMLITAVLQFLRYVRVLGVTRPSRFMIKLTLIGWGFPCLPVIIVLLLDTDNYIPNPSMEQNMCYPSGIYLIIGVVVPICLILFTNVVLFLLVIKAISKKSNMRTTDRSLVCAQLRLSIFLFFLLGLTWVFGILSFFGNIVFSYLFCLTATVQGFVLFIYFIICDPTTRKLWVTVMKPQFSSSRNSVCTISSG